jgi:hypothetical protein
MRKSMVIYGHEKRVLYRLHQASQQLSRALLHLVRNVLLGS